MTRVSGHAELVNILYGFSQKFSHVRIDVDVESEVWAYSLVRDGRSFPRFSLMAEFGKEILGLASDPDGSQNDPVG